MTAKSGWLAATWGLLLCVHSLGAAGEPEKQVSKPAPYRPDRFPIMAYSQHLDDSKKTQKWYQGIADCGFTVVGFCDNIAQLNRAKAAGLKAFVVDENLALQPWEQADPAKIEAAIDQAVATFGSDKTTLGFYLWDEPKASQFKGLSLAVSRLRESAPRLTEFVCMLPNYAKLDTSYREFLTQYVETVSPAVLCYNFYGTLEGGKLRDGYWDNLNDVQFVSAKAGIPFWTTVLSCPHFNFRELSDADIRFQVFSAIVYGAKGIAYYLYQTPTIGNYRLGPIDIDGSKTETWYMVKRVNRVLNAWGPTLLQLHLKGAYHLDKAEPAAGEPSNLILTNPGSTELVVGEFEHEDGGTYLIILNKNLSQSAGLWPVWRKKPSKIERLREDATWVPFSGEDIWLAPGQAALLRIEE
ncbi:MAG: hypothetical protein NTV93_08720 [Verrucomicrobia bacterium]|nr:hypothetical protein [Verrucomicrobiota bacterium]